MAVGVSPRLKTFPYVGCYRYFLTQCAHGRAKLFVSPDVVSGILLQIRLSGSRLGVAILAYCFMPDHLHLLVEGTSVTSDFLAFSAAAKQRSGLWYAEACGRRLWQRGFYDRVLRAEEDTMGVCRYIWHNPVRAGLVESPADYAFSGSDVFPFPACLEDIGIRQRR